MKVDTNKLFDAKSIPIKENVSNIDTVLEYEQILLSISKAISNYRRKYKLTQKELASRLNVNQVMISKLERGNYNPTVKLLHSISRKLTDSSNLFIDMLKDIIVSLYKSQNIKYSLQFQKYETYQYGLKNNITYLVCNTSNTKKGGKIIYGKINNKFSITR